VASKKGASVHDQRALFNLCGMGFGAHRRAPAAPRAEADEEAATVGQVGGVPADCDSTLPVGSPNDNLTPRGGRSTTSSVAARWR